LLFDTPKTEKIGLLYAGKYGRYCRLTATGYEGLTRPLLFIWIVDLVETAVANEPAVRHGEIRALGHDRLLDLDDLSHVIASGPELLTADALEDAGQQLVVDVLSVVNSAQVAQKVL
jgi:hypothetical protein